MEPRKSLVVALGNPLAGPDGFGAAVLERVRAIRDLGDVADLLDAHTDLLGQIDHLARYQRVILIDAILGVEPSGQVAVYDEDRFAGWSDTSSGCHQISPLMVIKLLRRLNPGTTPRVLLVGWSVEEIARGLTVPRAVVETGARLVIDLLFNAATSTVASPSCAE
jgi:hydrogenase maturation protease